MKLLVRIVLLLATSVTAQTIVAQGTTIANFSIGPNRIVGGTNDTALATVSLSDGHPAEYIHVYLSSQQYLLVYEYSDLIFAPGETTKTSILRAGLVADDTGETATARIIGSESTTTFSVEVQQPFASFTVNPAAIDSAGTQVAQGTLRLKATSRGNLGVGFPTDPPNAVNLNPPGVVFAYGEIVKVIEIRGRGPAEDTLVSIGVQESGADHPSLMASILVTASNSNDKGPCKKQCDASGGAPINFMNGDTWISATDYSIPGLGGGLNITRTWNSLWQNQRPPRLAGLFGHSWSTNMQERMQTIAGGGIRYWTADGNNWVFGYNSINQTYRLITPPNEHTALTDDPAQNQWNLRLLDGTQKIFDRVTGYLVAIIDRNGNRTAFEYTGGKLTQVTDAARRTVIFNYNDATNPDQVTSIQDSVGTIASYQYEAPSRLKRVSYADGTVLNYNYDSNNLILNVTDGAGRLMESHTYDGNRRGLTSSRANNVEKITVSYPAVGMTRLINSYNQGTDFTFASVDGKLFIQSGNGPGCSSCGAHSSFSKILDPLGNPLSYRDARGNSTNYTYDPDTGNIASRSRTYTDDTGQHTATWQYTYDSFGQVNTARNPLGHVSTYDRDPINGNLLSVTTPSPDGVLPPSITYFEYNDLTVPGRVTKITDPNGQETNFQYWPTGLLKKKIDAYGRETYFEYDARGHRTLVRDAFLHDTRFEVDEAGRIKKVTYLDGTHEDFHYDPVRKRVDSFTDQNGNVTNYGYDDADRLTTITDAQVPTHGVTRFDYDTENNLTKVTDGLGRETAYHYDPSTGFRDYMRFPGQGGPGPQETYTYDPNGNLKTKTDRKNQQIRYDYDELNRLVTKTWVNATPAYRANYKYDAADRLIKVTDPTGVYQFDYDDLDRLKQTTTAYFGLPALVVKYEYDPASNRTKVTDPQNQDTTYDYDDLNRLQRLTNTDTADQYTFDYDELSRRKTLTRPNGVVTSYNYDDLSHLLSVQHKNGPTVLDGASYSYDDAMGRHTGLRQSKTDLAGGIVSKYTYDPLYQLRQVDQSSTAESYTYDAVGNRLTSLGGIAYTYGNPWNRLMSVSGAPGITFQYDDNGNRRTKVNSTETTTFNWDYEDRLTSVVLPGTGGIISFKYDPFGRRIQKSSPAGTINYVYDDVSILEELDATGIVVLAKYTNGPGPDEPLAMLRDGTITFFESDGLGSITSLSDSEGAVTDAYTYDSYGNITTTSVAPNPFRYAGREFDSETGLYYYRARYYDPQPGRFLNEDPLRFFAGANFYAYVSNDPVNYTDPSGLFPTSDHRMITRAAALNLGYDGIDADSLANAVAAVDFLPHSQEKGAEFANLHAMAGVLKDGRFQTCEEAYAAAQANLKRSIALGTYSEIARALHLIQDSYSPAHKAYPQWNGGYLFHIPGLAHIYGDQFKHYVNARWKATLASQSFLQDLRDKSPNLQTPARYLNPCGCN